MSAGPEASSERVLILAPVGRDAAIAAAILGEVALPASVCTDLACLCRDLREGGRCLGAEGWSAIQAPPA